MRLSACTPWQSWRSASVCILMGTGILTACGAAHGYVDAFGIQRDKSQHDAQLRNGASRLYQITGYERAGIARLLEVNCGVDQIHVHLHYESSYSGDDVASMDVIRGSHMTVGATGTMSESLLDAPSGSGYDNPCRARDTASGTLLLIFGLKDCNTKTDKSDDNKVIYHNEVNVQLTKSNRTEQFLFPVSCTYPKDPAYLQQAPFMDISLFGFKSSQKPWSFPRHVDIGQYMYLDINARLPWLKNDQELQGFPVNCWLSVDHFDSSPKNMFLSNGCPTKIATSSGMTTGLSLIYYKGKLPIRVALKLTAFVLPKGANMSYAHCQAMPCTRSYTDAIYGFSLCPLSHHCRTNSASPQRFNADNLYHVSAGPLYISETANDAARAISVKRCSEVCSPAVIPTRLTPIINDGVSIQTVALVAFTSFLIGVFFTFILWIIHNRKIRLQKRQQKEASNLSSGTTPLMLNQTPAM